jgi:hypothetical protein
VTKKGGMPIEELALNPVFDLELFMILSQNKRLDAPTAAIADECWVQWRDRMRGVRLGPEKGGYLLVWLDESVEREVNKAWDDSPSRAFTMNSVAQSMLMAAIRDLVPEVAAGGCAPVPQPTPALKKALKELGVAWSDSAALERQYAMLTPFPFKGGCAICFLNDTCPNAGKHG